MTMGRARNFVSMQDDVRISTTQAAMVLEIALQSEILKN